MNSWSAPASDDRAFLADTESWRGGPLFEVYLAMATLPLLDMSHTQAVVLLREMGVQGPYRSYPDVAAGGPTVSDWRTTELVFGVWDLGAGRSVGVLIGAFRHDPYVAYLGIPPAHARRAFTEYPWSVGSERVPEEVLDFHRAVVARVRSLHRAVPVRGALLCEEGWPYELDSATSGILIESGVAKSAGLNGRDLGFYHCLEL